MTVKVVQNGQEKKNLLQLLRESGQYIDAPCGGRGTCGRCKVRLLSGTAEPMPREREIFSGRELAEGWRLACLCVPEESCEVFVPKSAQTSMAVETEFYGETGDKGHAPEAPVRYHSGAPRRRARRGIAVDIGTTTLAAALIDPDTGETLRTVSAVNRQRAYGADVISRIRAAEDGATEALRQSILCDIKALAAELCGSHPAETAVIAGNTVMCHLLLGYSCAGLGRAPFTPVDISLKCMTWKELFGEDGPVSTVTVLPGISAFIGGDITAGIYSLSDLPEKGILLDIGTNGEMVLAAGDRYLAASVAAGPAFEGGNISCGVPGVPGAVSGAVLYGKERMVTKTIGGQPPVGLCGTGIIDVVYELIRHRLIDEQGTLKEPWFSSGFPVVKDKIVFTQEDIRQVQLAKAAIRAGLLLLTGAGGISLSEVTKVYVAGGFGFHLNLEKAIGIGLLPAEWKGKITAVGNSALAGAKKYLTESAEKGEEAAAQKLCAIAERTETLNLALSPEFEEAYCAYLPFPG